MNGKTHPLQAREDRIEAAQVKMATAGYSKDEIEQFGLLREGFNEIAGALAVAWAMVDHHQHVPSAHLALALAEYMRRAAQFMDGVLKKSGVDPEVFELRSDLSEFYSHLDRVENIARGVTVAPASDTETVSG